MSAPEQWLTAAELAAELRVHVTTIRRKANTGEIPCLRVGRALRFNLADVRAPKPPVDVWSQPARARRAAPPKPHSPTPTATRPGWPYS